MKPDTMEVEVPTEVAVVDRDRAEDVNEEQIQVARTPDEVSPASKQKRQETARRAEDAMRKLMEGVHARTNVPGAVPTCSTMIYVHSDPDSMPLI